jgi:hypothetical protein
MRPLPQPGQGRCKYRVAVVFENSPDIAPTLAAVPRAMHQNKICHACARP